MKKLRMLAMTTSYPLHPGSSAGVFVQSLYQQLSAGYAIDVVCPADSNPIEVPFSDGVTPDIRIHAVRYAPNAWRTLAQGAGGVVTGLQRAPWRIFLLPGLLLGLFWRGLQCAGDADLIHANWSVCGAMAGIIGRLRRKPVITTLRGSDVARATRSRLDRMILGLAVRNSRIVICVSDAMAERLRVQFPHRAADIHACLNGADEAFFQVDRAVSEGTGLRVLAVGNLIRLKGFDVLIEALSRARHSNRMHVCIVGDGPERESLLAQAASRGVSSCFTFVGTVPASDMPKRISDADVFVLSSRSEGRPNVVVEALAGGLPVISTDLEGVQGMVRNGDTGWLVAVDDANALAAALDQAAADRAELQRRGERARAFACTQIGTWADTARCYESLFQTAMNVDERQRSSCAE
ncbi:MULTISPECIES: glycosyltransferase [unclassified Dyella]|uniref:glycosyltransferase n=1 Tax=unclassified Dyella TaxID=2634549 RepID=UPI000C853C04|nr:MULTISPECIES: glycosyltransferase [unclassified Dyella]MDR3444774.1 glycosyltransferase [Dyella sp.]PMQ06855.1 putative teichuronic acid biosynthesis glycosyltransferase TuaC [Dyella sp. AD56]